MVLIVWSASAVLAADILNPDIPNAPPGSSANFWITLYMATYWYDRRTMFSTCSSLSSMVELTCSCAQPANTRRVVQSGVQTAVNTLLQILDYLLTKSPVLVCFAIGPNDEICQSAWRKSNVRCGSLADLLINTSLMSAFGGEADVQACGPLCGVASWTGNKDGSGGSLCTLARSMEPLAVLKVPLLAA